MTKTDDIRQLIAEDITSPAERKALHHLTDALQEALEGEVPYRPEFKAELRQKLMAQARRGSSPWYRRPGVIYSSMGVAAAALVLAMGLQFYRKAPEPAPMKQNFAATPAPVAPDSSPFMVSSVTLPPVSLPDQLLPAGAPVPATVGGIDLTTIRLYRLTGQPDAELAARIAQGLEFTQPPHLSPNGYTVAEAGRSLTVAVDGRVSYSDAGAGSPQDPPVVLDESAVRATAQHFLTRASLPVPGLEATVQETSVGNLKHVYAVTYTSRVDGRPLVNGQTVVYVTDRYGILAAEAFTPAGQELAESSGYSARSPDEALVEAGKGGGTFTRVDLAYARTAEGATIYLQPVWRAFGRNAKGQQVVRYIQALVQK